MKQLLYIFACASLLVTSCSKDKDDPAGSIRVEAMNMSEGQYVFYYNEQNQLTQILSTTYQSQPPAGIPGTGLGLIHGKIKFEYSGSKPVLSQSSFAIMNPYLELNLNRQLNWKFGRLSEIVDENSRGEKTSWFSDSKNRITAYERPDNGTLRWLYDAKGNVIPASINNLSYTGSISYTDYPNPFMNTNTGLLLFAFGTRTMEDAFRFLSANLPLKWETTSTNISYSMPGTPPVTLTTKSVINYSYTFDVAGLLTGYTENRKTETRNEDGTLSSQSENIYQYPVSCYRMK